MLRYCKQGLLYALKMSLFYPEHYKPGQVPIIEDAMNVTQFYVFAVVFLILS